MTRVDDAQRDRVDDGVDVDRARREQHPVHQRPAHLGERIAEGSDAVAVDRGVEQIGRALQLVRTEPVHVFERVVPRLTVHTI